MESLPCDSGLDELVARRASAGELRTAARTRGHRILAEDGLRRVLDGSTSLAELARVVDLSGVEADDIARLADEANA
jgi:general secretion pathway protein E/type IV pilus assembly protein PilB